VDASGGAPASQADMIGNGIISGGSLLPDVSGTFDLGSSSNRWRQLWLSTLASVNSLSDQRLKDKIIEIQYGLVEILELEAVQYKWKDSVRLGSDSEFGLIAQEVLKIIPEIVSSDESNNNELSISYLELIPVLIKSIQEQQVLIMNQQAQIDELRSGQAAADKRISEFHDLKTENNKMKERLDAIEHFLEHLKESSGK
jgi:hypothetical protein